jgi:hypothetical protein
VGCSCFLSGTRIKIPKGEIKIEELRIGDKVLTVSGEAKPIFSQAEGEEEIVSVDVPDEALEPAASAERQAFT